MRVLVISAHPDDETVGAGGTLLQHAARADELFWLIVTQAYEPKWSRELIRSKATEVDAVAAAYGMRRVVKLGRPSTRLDTVPQGDLMDEIAAVARDVRPETVYLVNRSDVHSDHRALFEATMAVFKPFHSELGVRRILSFETQSSTDAAPALAERSFVPNVFSDITRWMERKLEIMSLYRTEAQAYPKPRALESMRALARYRGATIGVEYAEAFMLLREVT